MSKYPCLSNLFQQLLINSISAATVRTVKNKMRKYTGLESDGALFWILLTRTVFPSTRIFQHSLFKELTGQTLENFDDIDDFLQHVEDYSHLLVQRRDDEIVGYMFDQLIQSDRPKFVEIVERLKQDYALGKTDFTPESLGAEIQSTIERLKQWKQWDIRTPQVHGDAQDLTMQAIETALQGTLQGLLSDTKDKSLLACQGSKRKTVETSERTRNRRLLPLSMRNRKIIARSSGGRTRIISRRFRSHGSGATVARNGTGRTTQKTM
jgi:hypothetical protein